MKIGLYRGFFVFFFSSRRRHTRSFHVTGVQTCALPIFAAMAAASFDKGTTVNVPENGLIALNVPLDALRFGALSTRDAHTHLMTNVPPIVDALDLNVQEKNPYRHRTKGEMMG